MPNSIPPPALTPLNQILPAEPLLLMGAGPVPIPQPVAQANGVIINHLGPTMDRVIQAVKRMAGYAFQTRGDKILGVAGPSSAALEMGIANLCWPGRRVLALVTGTFSERLAEMAEAVGGEVQRIVAPPGAPVHARQVREALAAGQFDLVTLVQGETSCGICNYDLPEIVQLATEHGALSIVDAVCTLSTMPLQMDDWGIDVTVTGGQKGVSSIPGVSLIAFSDRAWEVLEKRTASRPHWCLDAIKAQRFWGHQQYHYTAPVPGILALHEALRLIAEETLERRFKRHEVSSLALQAGVEAMGLKLFAPEAARLRSVVAICLPEGVDSARVREHMTRAFRVEISGAFGLDIIRIGQMGEQCRSHNLFKTLHALGMGMRREGVTLNVAAGMAKLEEGLSGDPDHVVD